MVQRLSSFVLTIGLMLQRRLLRRLARVMLRCRLWVPQAAMPPSASWLLELMALVPLKLQMPCPSWLQPRCWGLPSWPLQ